MALTIAGMVARGTTVINDGEASDRMFPRFVEAMQTIGANITLPKEAPSSHIVLVDFKNVDMPANYGVTWQITLPRIRIRSITTSY